MGHRTLSLMLRIRDALASLGFHDESGQRIFEENPELRQINVVAIDWKYPGTSLNDADPLRFDFMPESRRRTRCLCQRFDNLSGELSSRLGIHPDLLSSYA